LDQGSQGPELFTWWHTLRVAWILSITILHHSSRQTSINSVVPHRPTDILHFRGALGPLNPSHIPPLWFFKVPHCGLAQRFLKVPHTLLTATVALRFLIVPLSTFFAPYRVLQIPQARCSAAPNQPPVCVFRPRVLPHSQRVSEWPGCRYVDSYFRIYRPACIPYIAWYLQPGIRWSGVTHTHCAG